MHFQHILAEDITWEEGALLDKARQQVYDGLSPQQLGFLIKERHIDVWRLVDGPTFIICTYFEEGITGRTLNIQLAAGSHDDFTDAVAAVKEAIKQLMLRLGCKDAEFTSKRPGVASHFGAVEVARIYRLKFDEGEDNGRQRTQGDDDHLEDGAVGRGEAVLQQPLQAVGGSAPGDEQEPVHWTLDGWSQ